MLPASPDRRTRIGLAFVSAAFAIAISALGQSNVGTREAVASRIDTGAILTQERPGEPPYMPGDTSTPRLGRKQRQALLKSEFEKLKRDADELADLAKSLQDEVDKSSENVFSLTVVEKADRIEKLAKRIKGAAKVH